MTKALKVVMIVYGIVHIFLGLFDIFAHDLVAKMFGFTQVPSYVNWMGEVIGALFTAIGFWVVVASRDPLRNINWVKLIITTASLVLVVGVHSVLVGYVQFSQVGASIVLAGIFVAALLACYPWRAARIVEKAPSKTP